MTRIIIRCLLLLLIALPAFSATPVHKCVGKGGKVTYTDQSCPDETAESAAAPQRTPRPPESDAAAGPSQGKSSLSRDARSESSQLVDAYCNAKPADQAKLKEELVQTGPLASLELVAVLRGDNAACWEKAAGILFVIGPRGKNALPELLGLLRSGRNVDLNPGGSASAKLAFLRRTYVATAASAIGKGEPSFEDALIDILKSGDPYSRGLAAKLLGDMKAGRATGALAHALSDSSASVAESAAAALQKLGPAADTAVPALADAAAKNREAYLGTLCMRALTAIGTPEAMAALRSLGARK